MFTLLLSCNSIPEDPQDTFEKAVESGLLVGYTINPPWVEDDSLSVGGTEGILIKNFAVSNDMDIIWYKGSEQYLLKKLEKKELHMVIGGFTKDTPSLYSLYRLPQGTCNSSFGLGILLVSI